jgi:hypothetical protein
VNVQETIALLEELHSIDAELGKARKSLESGRAAVAELLSEKAGYEVRKKSAADEAAIVQKSQRDAQSEVRSTHGQIDGSREKLSRARNEKEVLAAERELEELRRIARDRERDAERADLRVKELAAEEAKLDGQIGDVGARISAASEGGADLGGLEAEIASHDARRATLATKIPVAVFRKYDAIKAKRGTALAHVKDGHCLTCNIGLPPALFHKLRREPSLETCPNCQRFLYFKA